MMKLFLGINTKNKKRQQRLLLFNTKDQERNIAFASDDQLSILSGCFSNYYLQQFRLISELSWQSYYKRSSSAYYLKSAHLNEFKPKIDTKVNEVTALIKEMALKNPDTKHGKIILECTKGLPEEVVANLPTYTASRQLCTRAKVDKYEDFKIPFDLHFDLDDYF
ncbi:unnamed protein product [Brachionus calyciflorus]|uniref:Uncharacterized protein n=1 Tax=Brachionus calyciflorus TaxID=104777 RepID=A0A814ERM1_9BILA|nr:unnamed protein product [Brachionus calyciflorus]